MLTDDTIERVDKLLTIVHDTLHHPKLKILHDLAMAELEKIASEIEQEQKNAA